MNVQRQIDRLIAERASEWVEILRSGKAEEYPEFVRWVSESPRHLREFMTILALREELPGAFARAGIDRDALLKRVSSNVMKLQKETPVSTFRPPAARTNRLNRLKLVAAAAAVLTIGAGIWMTLSQNGQTYATAVGEQRTVTLADGSLIYLNAHSTARANFKDHSRDIELIDGEALFQVARDPQRPFRVHTKDAVVQAIGTRFNVDTRPARTVVSVLEGKVEVSTSPESEKKDHQPLQAGEAAEVTREGKLQRRSDSDVAGAAAWRERQLVFAKTSLEDVATEFNRFHKKGRLLLQDIDADSHHYTGTFNADDIASFAAMLAREPDLTVEQKNGDYVVRGR